MSSDATPSSSPRQRTFLGHPVGLYILFFTEMWERFSYYGMRALLTLYMVNYFKWSQESSSKVYKWYTSLVYLTPLLGGFLADRYLGNKKAVVIGAVLMAVGHFLMAFEAYEIFYAALVFLILGNGFFKPNMSTQVGRLYPPNDVRRDGAYTIFYMGINLGAFLAPLLCGWLAQNTQGRYHTGFTMAGIGMVFGLLIYVFGMPWVVELEQDEDGMTQREAVSAPEGGELESNTPQGITGGPGATDPQGPADGGAISEAAAAQTASSMPTLNRLAPMLMMAIGVGAAAVGPILAGTGIIDWDTCIGMEIGAICAFISAWITSRVEGGLRDRVLTIYILGIFVVLFWAAFEQAGNALNLWADKTTDRYLSQTAPEPELYPKPAPVKKVEGDEVVASDVGPTSITGFFNMFKPIDRKGTDEEATKEGNWFTSLWNPVPTAWFQSINPIAIFVLAPLFAALWTYLGRRGMNPSIPTKMAIGVTLMSLSFVVMILAVQQESKTTTVSYAGDKIPTQIHVNAQGQLCEKTDHEEKCYQAGRLRIESGPQGSRLVMQGVLPDIERDRIVRDTAPKSYQEALEKLQKKFKEAQEQNKDPKKKIEASVVLDPVPPGFNLKYAGFNQTEVTYDEKTHTLTTHMELAEKDVKSLLVAGGDPAFRDAIDDLYINSSHFKVSSWWLFWCYIFATLGELCLSPVGLSMVSKLAPAKFATMLMGLWLVTSFFGNFAAGAFGERWGLVAPDEYFLIPVVILGVAAVILFLFTRKVVSMMHGVN